MNKKGQSLVLFIIFLPLIVIALAFVVDVGLMYNAKIKGERLLEEAKRDNYNIEEYFKLNNLDISLKNSSGDKGSCVIIKYRVESVFGRIINFNSYDIEVTDC